MTEHFHVAMYAKGAKMYDVKCDRIDAIDLASRFMTSVYSGLLYDEGVQRKLALALSKKDDEEIAYLLSDPENPINCTIRYCNDECGRQPLWS